MAGGLGLVLEHCLGSQFPYLNKMMYVLHGGCELQSTLWEESCAVVSVVPWLGLQTSLPW